MEMKRHPFRATIASLAIFSCLLPVTANAGQDLTVIRERLNTTLLTSPPRDGAAEKLLESQKPDGTWPGIDYQNLSREAFEHRNHLSHAVEIARAWRHPDSKLHRDPKLFQAVERALQYWVDHDFIGENWFHNQIGTPSSLIDLMLLIGDALPPELVEKAQPMIGRAHLNATGARPSGDRIKIAGILAKNLVFLDLAEPFNEVIKVIEGEIQFASGPGMQHDFSFHHRTDGVNNTLSYGASYADSFAEWAEYVAGTSHAFSDPAIHQLTDFYLDGICKQLDNRGYPDPGAMNREMSRQRTLSPAATRIAHRLLNASDYRKSELMAVVANAKDGKSPLPSHATSFWRTDYFTFRRPSYFTSVRMFSNRNFNMEVPYNSEGLLNHHRGDGTNHVVIDGDEYHNIWPAFDMQKIPGTTVMQKPQLPSEDQIHRRGLKEFVGAATDGKHGVAAFDFQSPHDPLAAKKAWFFFDDAYVCLGTGITCTGAGEVVTTLNQCHLKGDVTVMQDNRKSTAPEGARALDGANWLFHNGVGYVFPTPSSVNLSNQIQSGSWLQHSKQSRTSREELEIPIFKLWIDHGTQPKDASYAYIVVPGTNTEELAKSAKTRPILILENRPDLQAVRHTQLGIFQVVFYQPGALRIAENMDITSTSPAIVMLRAGSGSIRQITVADPTQKLTSIQLSLPAKLHGHGDHFTTTWNEDTQTSDLTIHLPQGPEAGRSVVVKF